LGVDGFAFSQNTLSALTATMDGTPLVVLPGPLPHLREEESFQDRIVTGGKSVSFPSLLELTQPLDQRARHFPAEAPILISHS
jgi:hypothetical protein